jgi:hypothetical protein
MKKILASVIVIGLLVFNSIVWAECERAGTGVACVGDSKYSVIQKCGPPNYSEGTGAEARGDSNRVTVEGIEKLYYSEGRFTRIFTFRGGVLVRIEVTAN